MVVKGTATFFFASAQDAALLADLVAGFHLLVVAFVILGLLLTLLGWLRRWEATREPWFRFSHAAVMTYIAGTALSGKLCFLTYLEGHLRREAGLHGQEGSFIGRLLHDILFVEADQGLLTTIYVLIFALELSSLHFWRPRLKSRRAAE